MVGVGKFAVGHAREGGQAGLGRDVANRAAFRARAKQGALGATQHFHPIKIEHGGQGVVGVQPKGSNLDGRVVDIDAGGAGAGG